MTRKNLIIHVHIFFVGFLLGFAFFEMFKLLPQNTFFFLLGSVIWAIGLSAYIGSVFGKGVS